MISTTVLVKQVSLKHLLPDYDKKVGNPHSRASRCIVVSVTAVFGCVVASEGDSAAESLSEI